MLLSWKGEGMALRSVHREVLQHGRMIVVSGTGESGENLSIQVTYANNMDARQGEEP